MERLPQEEAGYAASAQLRNTTSRPWGHEGWAMLVCHLGTERKMSRNAAKKTFTVSDPATQTEGIATQKDAGRTES